MKVHELLAQPGAWTQNVYARDQNGIHVGMTSPDACSWCLAGAVFKCYDHDVERTQVWDRLYDRLGVSEITWNDETGRTQEEVVALCKELDI